ncbi:MAG: AtpZ/AtpI family protein [Proteobacteria bacterium]|nr:AtpZ/AtpI family protein [Pseudomonadota bacterium]
MSDQVPEQDLEKLESRLRDARARSHGPIHEKKDNNQPPNNALGLAFRVGVELVSAIAIGVGIGWLLDQWLDTRPWLMLVFIFLGGAAGILNVYRMASGFGYAVGYQKGSDPGVKKAPDQRPGIEE